MAREETKNGMNEIDQKEANAFEQHTDHSSMMTDGGYAFQESDDR